MRRRYKRLKQAVLAEDMVSVFDLSGIADGDLLRWNATDELFEAASPGTLSLTASQITDFTEAAQDAAAACVTNGTGLTWAYNDTLNTLTGTVSLAAFSTTNLAEGTNLYFTDERAQDAVGGMVANSARVTLAYVDATPSLTADLVAGSVDNSYLSDMAEARVLGRAAGAGTGAKTDLTGAQVAAMLSYTNITSGTVPDGNLSANIPKINATNTFTGAQIFTSNKTTITNSQPRLAWIESDAPAGTTNYEIIVSAGSMIRRMMNDDNTFGANFEALTRSGNVITNWSMIATVVTITGNLSLGTAGNKLLIKEGTNASMGSATLVGGTVTVNTTLVTASSRIFLTVQSLGTVAAPKALAVTARSAGTSFTITSEDATDTSVVAWHIIEPA